MGLLGTAAGWPEMLGAAADPGGRPPGPAPARAWAIAATARPAAERVFAGYLLAQAVAGIGWWLTLARSPPVRSWFELSPGRPEVLDAFAVADAVVIAGSALGARGLLARRPWTVPVVAFTAGGLVYPTLYLVGWVSFTGAGSPCLAIMVPPTVFTCWIARNVRVAGGAGGARGAGSRREHGRNGT
jgi:hypothetical protein